MEILTSDMTFSKSGIISLSFNIASPSNYDTVYTSLITAAEKRLLVCKKTVLLRLISLRILRLETLLLEVDLK